MIDRFGGFKFIFLKNIWYCCILCFFEFDNDDDNDVNIVLGQVRLLFWLINVFFNYIQVFIVLFVVEIVFCLIVMGFMGFICSRWNVFDIIVVIGSLLGYFYKFVEGFSIF